MASVAEANRTSVIVTSYNQRATLELLLASLARQTQMPLEVIIADDGSKDSISELAQVAYPFSFRFITQEDVGYRKSKILNEAIRNSRGDYLVFLDADVVLERHFVEDHLKLAEQDAFVCGRRVDLGPSITATLSAREVGEGFFDRLRIKTFLSARRGDSENIKRALRITPPWLRRWMGYHKPIDILGSNLSLWKKDLIEVNGFNESIEAYWGEDGDLYIRLRNAGKKAISAKGLCVQYHFFHKRRLPTAENVSQVTELLANRDYKWAERGLS